MHDIKQVAKYVLVHIVEQTTGLIYFYTFTINVPVHVAATFNECDFLFGEDWRNLDGKPEFFQFRRFTAEVALTLVSVGIFLMMQNL